MLPLMSIGPDSSGDASRAAENRAGSARSFPYEPTVADVFVVKAMLTKALRIPPEIIDSITDIAEYWPHTTAEARFEPPVVVRGGNPDENKFLLRAPPLGLRAWRRSPRRLNSPPPDRTPLQPQPVGDEFSTEHFQKLTASPPPLLAHPCRRIVFTITSHDQGWGGEFNDHGTYRHSWTWFEAGLERWCESNTAESDIVGQQAEEKERRQQPSLMLGDLSTVLPEVERNSASGQYEFIHPLHSREDLKVQCNVVADRDTKEHRVVWSYTDDIDPERDVEAATKLSEQGRGTATGNGKFVRELKLGDVVTLWAKARFGGWTNNVESVKIDVYYAV